MEVFDQMTLGPPRKAPLSENEPPGKMASTSLQVIHNQLLSNVHLNLLRALTAAGLMLD